MTRACSRSKITVERRQLIRRQRAAMPRRTPPEIVALIERLLLKGKTVPEVQQAVQDRGYEISVGPIYRERYRLGLDPEKPGPAPGSANAGRPKGRTDSAPRKRFSPYRARVVELRDRGMSYGAIAAQIEQETGNLLTKQGVAKLLQPIDGEPEK